MPVTNITPLPTPPTRSDPTNFSDRADTFLSALPTMVTEFNTAADQIEAAEAAAETAADTATAMASAAANSAGATVWVSGTPYAQYDPVVDPVDLKTYRAKNAITSSTRPGLDAANWAVTQGQGDVVLNGAQFGFRNHVINGCFNVVQRVPFNLLVSNASGLPLGDYTVFDRWKAGTASTSFTISGGAHTVDTSYVTYPHTIDITAGTLRQILERINMPAGTYYVTWTGTAQGRVSTGSGAGSGAYVASGFSFVATGTDDYSLEFNTGTVTNVQVERGGITPFEFRSPLIELHLARRYFWAGSNVASGELLVDKYGNATDQLAGLVVESVSSPGFRVTPTIGGVTSTATNLTSTALIYTRGAIRPNSNLSATGRGYLAASGGTTRHFTLDADFAG